jgi:hypothetical protein
LGPSCLISRTKVRNLIKMGVPKDLEMQEGNTRRGHWFATHTVAVNMAMTKEYDKSDRFFTLSKIKVRDIIKIIFIGFGVTEDRGQGNAYS